MTANKATPELDELGKETICALRWLRMSEQNAINLFVKARYGDVINVIEALQEIRVAELKVLLERLRFTAAVMRNDHRDNPDKCTLLLEEAADLIESLQNQPVDTTALPIKAQCESPPEEIK